MSGSNYHGGPDMILIYFSTIKYIYIYPTKPWNLSSAHGSLGKNSAPLASVSSMHIVNEYRVRKDKAN